MKELRGLRRHAEDGLQFLCKFGRTADSSVWKKGRRLDTFFFKVKDLWHIEKEPKTHMGVRVKIKCEPTKLSLSNKLDYVTFMYKIIGS